jgi:hypothetical protein
MAASGSIGLPAPVSATARRASSARSGGKGFTGAASVSSAVRE